MWGTLDCLPASYTNQPFPKGEKKTNRSGSHVFLHVHGTEDKTNYGEGKKKTT